MFEVFGADLPLPAKFFIAFVVVLALIGVTAWLVRRFGANRIGNANRGRQPRLAVIDATPVDARRRLVLIRRDNVEHLLMIGGPTDVVVEPNIVRAVGAREPTRVPAMTDTPARTAPAVENAWPLQPAAEPAPAPITAPRNYRAPSSEETWHPPEPAMRARPADSLTGLAAELSSRLNPPETARPVPRSEPAPRVTAAPVAAPVEPAASRPQDDQNLADMAQQLEAALRRSSAPDSRAPVTDPLAVAPRISEPRAPAREATIRLEPRFDAKPEAAAERRLEPKLDTPAPIAAKDTYASLEEEMASLLGRPTEKS
jgi:hypothetical protein